MGKDPRHDLFEIPCAENHVSVALCQPKLHQGNFNDTQRVGTSRYLSCQTVRVMMAPLMPGAASATQPLPEATDPTSVRTKFTFRHFAQLDGLRGLAIVLVLAGHVLEFGFGIHTDFGGLGVLLFFLLSGSLIT